VTTLAIRAVGAVTAVGEDAPATVGSIYTEAQISGTLPAKHRDGRRVVGAATPIGHEIEGAERIFMLAGLAFREATAELPVGTEIGLAVCLPAEDKETISGDQVSAAVERWSAKSGLHIPSALCRLFRDGTPTFEALAFAQAALDSRELEAVCVLSADSLVTKRRLMRMIQTDALDIGQHVPGEGAAAVLLSRRLMPDSWAALAAIGRAEKNSPSAAATFLREAAVEAIKTTLNSCQLGRTPLAALVHDLGNPPAGPEALAWIQSSGAFAAAPEMVCLAPAFSTGSTGVASGLLSLVTLAFLVGKATVAGPGLCVLADSDGRSTALALTPPPRRTADRR
jgi:hypothetical protein